MAQPSSMQREPSMEEILASIRRIIEDSDATTGVPPEHAAQTTSKGPDGAPALDVEPEPTDLAEVGQFEGAFDEDSAAGEPASASDAEAEIEPRSHAPNVQPFPAPPAATARQAAPGPSSLELAADTGNDTHHAAAVNGRDPVVHAPPVGLDAQQSDDTDDTDTRPAIISEKAGRQVAAAFEELSEAFAASRRRSFDEMAEEMLRPMLREWMDNNLPLLVERLVREEIERVARGN